MLWLNYHLLRSQKMYNYASLFRVKVNLTTQTHFLSISGIKRDRIYSELALGSYRVMFI
jgi:hypothetical protein